MGFALESSKVLYVISYMIFVFLFKDLGNIQTTYKPHTGTHALHISSL